MLERVARRLRALLRRDDVELELDEELRYHLERQVEQNLAFGMDPEEARYAALREFGGLEPSKEACRDARRVRWVEDLAQDLRHGLRGLVRTPGFTLLVALTLALGIGANTAVFSVLDAVVLRPLPYPESDRLVAVWEAREGSPGVRGRISLPDYLDWRAQNQSLEGIAAYAGSSLARTDGGEPEHLASAVASTNLFETLRVAPALGRGFSPENEAYGRHRVAVVSDGFWRRALGADPDAIGRQLMLDGNSYPVVGVLPAGFRMPLLDQEPDVWVPLAYQKEDLEARRAHYLSAVARLGPGVDLAHAQRDLGAVSARLAEVYPQANTGHGAALGPLREQVVGDLRPALLVLLGAVALVLLIACANVANLLLARATVRRREVAVRMALGASRWRLVRQFLVESVLLAAAGGAAGLAVAAWGVDTLVATNAGGLPRTADVGIDLRVLAFTAAVTAATGLAFGLLPALHASDVTLGDALKEAGRPVGGGRDRARSTFVVVQVALSLVLLVGSGLLLRSLHRLQAEDPGFDPSGVLTVRLTLPGKTYEEPGRWAAFVRQLDEQLRDLPGAAAAGVIHPLPYTDRTETLAYRVDDQPEAAGAQRTSAAWRAVTPGYFRALGVPVLRGRGLADADAETSRPVVVISETMARMCFGEADPLGHRLTIGYDDRSYDVVGVVGDTRPTSLKTAPGPEMYTAWAQTPVPWAAIVVRAEGDPSALAGLVRDRVAAIDPALPLYDVKTMEARLSESVGRQRFTAALAGLFAAVALALAAVGTYGVVSYLVERRTHEIGVRMALGARPGDVVRLVLGRGLALTVAGIGAGVVGALGLTRLLEGMLYGVGATDPVAFVATTLVLAAVALAACYVPARRAARVDPAAALRSE
jgi:putative ABC transport system permease protein